MTTILWIEGRRNVTPTFVPGLRKKGYLVETAPNGKTALERLSGLNPGLVVVHAASLRSSGRRICRSLRDRLDGTPILLIQGSEQPGPGNTTASQTLALPFTLRKLLNRIRALLPEANGEILRLGPLALAPDCNTVWLAGGKPQQLTPRLTAVLKTLMQHPGQVVKRKRLFREIWETDYLGDTRTLDVHISWLRKKIEKDPRHPRLLKTVHGVGYILDTGSDPNRRRSHD